MKRLLVAVAFLLSILIWFHPPVARANSAEGWDSFVIREGADWKPSFRDGRLRSAYGRSRTQGSTSEETAAMFLDSNASLLGLERPSDLRLERVDENEMGRSFLYRQYYGGYKVVGGEILIATNQERRVISVVCDYKQGLRGELRASTDTARTIATISRFLGGKARVTIGELMVYPMGKNARLVRRVVADSTAMSRGSWLMYVDAENPGLVLRARKTHATASGRGNVFLENPVVTPNRVVRTFKNMDGSRTLSGRFVRVYNGNFEQDVSEPIFLSDYTTAFDPGRNYNYPTTDARFAEAMAFFHINQVHDRWRKFGFRKLNKRAPVFVNISEEDGGAGFDNAFYTRDARFPTGIYVFGSGNILENLGLDADVYNHEYGHGVLDHQKPGLFEAEESNYPGAFHEGFGDISAAAITGNSKVAEFGLRLKSTKRFVGRDMDNTNRYPGNVAFGNTRKSEVHHTGLIVGGAWWDLMETIGADPAQRILFKALNLMPNELNFFDVRDAMLTADRNLNAGANQTAILNAFANHGITGPDPGQSGKLNVTTLKSGAYNFNTGKAQFKKTFKQTDSIVIVANYRASNLEPGYNIIPISGTVDGPGNLDGFLLLDEAVNGSRTGNRGALQAILFPDFTTTRGQYTVTIQSRLGGTDRTSAKKTVKFSIQ